MIIPAFTNRVGSIRHWPRFDNVYRTAKLEMMFIVVDVEDRYRVYRLDARSVGAIFLLADFPHGGDPSDIEAYRAANQYAARECDDWSRRLRDERREKREWTSCQPPASDSSPC